MENTTKNILNLIVVFCILAALTCGIDLQQFKNKLKKPKGVSIGLLCQFGILPVSSFLVALFLDDLFEAFTQPQGVALIILGSCPGGNVSNIFCFLWNADLSLSIAMTTASSILSFAFLTANCAIYIPIYSKGDTATIDYVSLAFSVAMVISGICVGFLAAYYENKRMKKILGVAGFVATGYMIWQALFGNATGSAPIWVLSWQIWMAPIILCSIAWILSLVISIIFKLPKKSVLTVCFESANQNSVLSAAIIYLSLDEYADSDIDLAIGIPIMYTIVAILFNGLCGLISCQLKWVNCKPPDHADNEETNGEDDSSLTLSVFIYKYRQWRANKRATKLLSGPKLLSEEDIDYGGMRMRTNGSIVMTLEHAKSSLDNEIEKSSDEKIIQSL